ncbi:hypothetical protein [Shewanella sp. MM_2022_3]|uniref:hypothetical protein n=1 Tax=Shewanella sp. MM_2022_3 TaxID=2923280 RepID=UPI001F4BFEA3|nr:hypothetical protein [Shewanella sp. MM_2022_3]MCH7421270.1 hypothetical protein [Shewanella sp. MM_2022_3]
MENQQEFLPTVNPMTATVQEMFGQVLQQRIQSGALEQAIGKYADKLIDDAARDCFQSYGDVGKVLKEQFAKAIMPQLESIADLPTYNEYVTNRLKLATQQFYDNRLAAILDKELNELLTELPEQITLSWLVQKVIAESREYNDDYEGEITLIIEEDNTYGKFAQIYLDKESDRSKRDCKYNLHMHQDKESGKWEIIGLRVDGHKAGEQLSMGRQYGFEKILFNVYAMKGQIEFDEGTYASSYETSWCND